MSGAHSVFRTRISFSVSDGSIVMWIRRMIDIATSSMWKDNVSKRIWLGAIGHKTGDCTSHLQAPNGWMSPCEPQKYYGPLESQHAAGCAGARRIGARRVLPTA